MARSILAVIAGYVVMALSIFLTLTCLYLLLGADASFRPGSYHPSTLWNALSLLLGALSAVAGGYACATLARGGRAPLALAALVLLLGLLINIPLAVAADDNAARPTNVPNMEAMMKAKQPGWMLLLNPFLGVACVLAGARLARKD
jgi:hypothetical protein